MVTHIQKHMNIWYLQTNVQLPIRKRGLMKHMSKIITRGELVLPGVIAANMA